MNATTEYTLYSIWINIVYKTDTCSADRILEPLKWYITTGRCDGEFIRKINKLNSRQITTVSNRLIKFNGMDYDGAISSVKEYISRVKTA